jgi:hypothetical protein
MPANRYIEPPMRGDCLEIDLEIDGGMGEGLTHGIALAEREGLFAAAPLIPR